MDFKDLLVERYSVRDYDERPIEEEKLQKILEAGRMAPTAVNFQPQRMMQATELGIGSLWVRGYKTADIVEAFDLPEDMVPVCLLLLGYASENDKAKRKNTSRLPLEETVKEI